MSIISFEAIINNDQIQLPPNIPLPNQTKVYVIVPDFKRVRKAHINTPHLVYPKQASDFTKEVYEEK